MKNEQAQKTLWLLAALAAPVAHFSGCGWLTAGLTALAVLPLALLPKCWEGFSKPMALLQILWIGIVAGSLLPGSAVYWPSDNDLAVPLTILALAAWTGAAAAPRIGAVLAFCMALLAIPMGISGAAHLKWEWLAGAWAPFPAGLAAALLMASLPVVGGGRKEGRLLGVGLLTVLAAALVQSVISPQVAMRLEDAFYQTSRTLGYLEPVAAVGMTLGWYAMTDLLLQSAVKIGKNSGLHALTASVLPVGTAAACILFRVQLHGLFYPVLSLFFWVLIPFLSGINFFEKR